MGSFSITNWRLSILIRLLATKKLRPAFKPRLSSSTQRESQIERSAAIREKEKFFDNEEDDERIKRLRDKSRLPAEVRREYVQDQMIQPRFEYHYGLKRLRVKYGFFGQKSGLNPGLCYPTAEELGFISERQRLMEKPLDVMLEELKSRKAQQAQKRKDREEEVERNMQNLLKWRQEMLQKQKKREDEARMAAQRRQLVIAEIREEIGFHIHEKDPRFKDAMEKREADAKKQAKEARKAKKKMFVKKLIIENKSEEGAEDQKKSEEAQED